MTISQVQKNLAECLISNILQIVCPCLQMRKPNMHLAIPYDTFIQFQKILAIESH